MADDQESNSSFEDPDEIMALRKEATMPITDVVPSNYQEASSHKTLSPMFRPKRSEASSSSNGGPAKFSLNDSQDESGSAANTKTEHTSNTNGSSSSNGDRAVLVNGNQDSSSIEESSVKEESKENKKDVKKSGTNGNVESKLENSEGEVNGSKSEDGDLIVNKILSYIGKGKSGGKGGKVKGKSAIATTRLEGAEETTVSGRPKREATDAKLTNDSEWEDMDSDEDDEDVDETFDLS